MMPGYEIDTRILLYVYQSAAIRRDGDRNLRVDSTNDAAQSLLSELEDLTSRRPTIHREISSMTEQSQPRPVIFVCYGLGGVIVKQVRMEYVPLKEFRLTSARIRLYLWQLHRSKLTILHARPKV